MTPSSAVRDSDRVGAGLIPAPPRPPEMPSASGGSRRQLGGRPGPGAASVLPPARRGQARLRRLPKHRTHAQPPPHARPRRRCRPRGASPFAGVLPVPTSAGSNTKAPVHQRAAPRRRRPHTPRPRDHAHRELRPSRCVLTAPKGPQWVVRQRRSSPEERRLEIAIGFSGIHTLHIQTSRRAAPRRHAPRCQRDVNQRPQPTATLEPRKAVYSAGPAGTRNQPQAFAPKW